MTWIINVVNIIAAGSLEADSALIIEVNLLSTEFEFKMLKQAAASVEEIMAHNKKDSQNSQPEKKEKKKAENSAVKKTPKVDKKTEILKTGFISLFLSHNP